MARLTTRCIGGAFVLLCVRVALLATLVLSQFFDVPVMLKNICLGKHIAVALGARGGFIKGHIHVVALRTRLLAPLSVLVPFVIKEHALAVSIGIQ